MRVGAPGAPAPSSPAVKAGFLAVVTAGSFEVPEGWARDVQVNGTQATHTVNGSRLLQWDVLWRAPDASAGRADLSVFVNVVNGNGGPDGGDRWDQRALSSAPTEASGAGGPGAPWGWQALAAAAALSAAVTFGLGRALAARQRAPGGGPRAASPVHRPPRHGRRR